MSLSSLGIREDDKGQYDRLIELQSAGCIWMIKREVVEKIGGYDEEYFMSNPIHLILGFPKQTKDLIHFASTSKKYLNIFGFGSDLGIDLPGESSGLIPDPAWKKSVKNEGWFTGDTYNVSIGQGDTIITPLQLASAIGAVANGGTLWKPKLVLKITDHRNNSIREFKPESIRANIVDESKLKVVREGLRKAVTEGSAYLLNDLPIKVAGKTGTAQITNTFRKTNAWFTGFAPYDNPEIALAIIVEGAGEGSTAAVPVAKEVFYWYYNKNYDKMIK